jgi:hypothetical protein
MRSFQISQENLSHGVMIAHKENCISTTSELIAKNKLNEEFKRSGVKTNIARKEVLDIMSLLDCLESSTKDFQQAEYFY